MKLVVLKADSPLQYEKGEINLILAGGCTINKVEDLVWDKVCEHFGENIKMLQERGVLTVSDVKGNKNQNKKQDEEAFQDLVDEKVEAQNLRSPSVIKNDQKDGTVL